MLGGGLLPAAAPPPHPALARGLELMREGDFEAAVLELDAAVRKIEADPAAARQRPWAYVYLGVAYLELEQEAVARGKFREALARDPGSAARARRSSPRSRSACSRTSARKRRPPLPDRVPWPRARPRPRRVTPAEEEIEGTAGRGDRGWRGGGGRGGGARRRWRRRRRHDDARAPRTGATTTTTTTTRPPPPSTTTTTARRPTTQPPRHDAARRPVPTTSPAR